MSVAASRWERIYAVVRKIPRGKVATYGQVADLAGLPGHARQVGYALAALRGEEDVPWQRVVNARGQVSERTIPGSDEVQRRLLEDEGIEFGLSERIDLERYRWRGGTRAPSSARRKRSGSA